MTEPIAMPLNCEIVAQADAEKRDAADALAAHYAKQGYQFTRAEMLHAVDAIRALLRRQEAQR
jgi:hypothetical protein